MGWQDDPVVSPAGMAGDPAVAPTASWQDKLTAVLHGARKGALAGFDDELGAAVQALAQHVSPSVRNPDGSEMSALDVYRQARGGNRYEEDQIRKQAPNYYTGGEVGGGLAATVGTGAGLGTAALLGGAQGLGDSQADLTDGDAVGALRDAAIGAGAGLVGAGVGHTAGKLLPMALRATRSGLEKLAIKTGRRVLNGGADLRNGLREVVSDDAVREALDAGAIRFGSTTEAAAQRLDQHVDDVAKGYSEAVQELEARGVPGPEARAIATKLTQRAAETMQTTGANKAVPRLFEREAGNVTAIADKQTGRLRLSQAEALKQDLQAAAKSEYGKLGGSKPLGNAKKEVAAVVRQANEDAVARAAQGLPVGDPVREAADQFASSKTRLSRAIAARDAAERGANKAAGRNAIGLRETIIAGPQAASGDLAGAAATLGITKAVTSRGASTIAATANKGAKLAKALANAATDHASQLTKGGAALGASAARALNSQRMTPLIDVKSGKQIGWFDADSGETITGL